MKYKYKYKYKFLLLFFSVIFLFSCEQKNDFDLICQYFDALEQDKIEEKTEGKALKSDDGSPNYSYTFINNLIENNIAPNSSASKLWGVVVSIDSGEIRYGIFKEGVIDIAHKPWQCPSMEKLLPTVYAGEH